MSSSKSVQKLISKVLLEGLYDQDSVLSQLRGCQHVMRRIWEQLLQHWARSICLPDKDLKAGKYGPPPQICDEERVQPFFLTSILPEYEFPNRDRAFISGSKLIDINMMPFIVGETFEAGLHKLCHPTIRDGSTWSKFGARGEHGDVFLLSNFGAL